MGRKKIIKKVIDEDEYLTQKDIDKCKLAMINVKDESDLDNVVNRICYPILEKYIPKKAIPYINLTLK